MSTKRMSPSGLPAGKVMSSGVAMAVKDDVEKFVTNWLEQRGVEDSD